jgi:hypothetical protein
MGLKADVSKIDEVLELLDEEDNRASATPDLAVSARLYSSMPTC